MSKKFRPEESKIIDEEVIIENHQQSPVPKPKRRKYYLSIQSKFKNEDRYLKEWLDFHLLVGVQHFYLYDEESNDKSYQILRPYIEEGTVTYIFWQNGKLRYDRGHCIENYGHESNWIAIIDVDEFLFPVKPGQTLDCLLRDYEDYPAVVVNWVLYGTNFHKKYEPGYVIERFFRREKEVSKTIKTILQPNQIILETINQYNHSYLYRKNRLAVNEEKKYVVKSNQIPYQSVNLLRINHYKTKSHEEMMEKNAKLKKRDESCERYANLCYYRYRFNTKNDVEDKILFRYLDFFNRADALKNLRQKTGPSGRENCEFTSDSNDEPMD